MGNGGRASVEVRSQNHVHMKAEAWAKTAEASGLGAGRFRSHFGSRVSGIRHAPHGPRPGHRSCATDRRRFPKMHRCLIKSQQCLTSWRVAAQTRRQPAPEIQIVHSLAWMGCAACGRIGGRTNSQVAYLAVGGNSSNLRLNAPFLYMCPVGAVGMLRAFATAYGIIETKARLQKKQST
jgi:hypothetical protein